MTNKDLYKIWAPFDFPWSAWTRPVLFANINDTLKINKYLSFEPNVVSYVEKAENDLAIFVDLPSTESIEEGIALAKLGYRLVPLYNGTESQEGVDAIIDNDEIEGAIIWGAKELNNMSIDKNAPPAFLLDFNRTERRRKDVSVFDNSWDLYYQDVPTAEYFLKNGIKRIFVRSRILQRDLKVIFYKYQKKGLKIFWVDDFGKIKKVNIKKAPKEMY